MQLFASFFIPLFMLRICYNKTSVKGGIYMKVNYHTHTKRCHHAFGSDEEYIYIITAYVPNTVKFEDDLKTRKGR